MEQKRFLLAITISALILFGWQFLVPRTPNPQNNPESPAASPQPTAVINQQPAPVVTSPDTAAQQLIVENSNVPQRNIVVETPLYKVTFDSRGGVPTSWIIKRNKKNNQPIYSVAGSLNDARPLELIPHNQSVQPLVLPLQIVTRDEALNAVLNASNYQINGVDENSSTLAVDNQSGKRSLSFALGMNNANLEVVKTIEFAPDSYAVTINTTLKHNGANVPDAKLIIGPSIGDQGVSHYTFYSVAPEAIAVINGEVVRKTGATIHSDEKTPENFADGGRISWAGVGDTYFAMVAIPTTDVNGIQYKTRRYEHQNGDAKEERHYVTGFLPIANDNAPTILYVGPKDHTLLENFSSEFNTQFNRNIDLEKLIDYGWFASISRPLATKILSVIEYFVKITGNYGLSIILFTIALYMLFFPLKWRSSKSMKKAQKYAPRMKELQEKIKGLKPNDARLKELQKEQLRLMKEGNPLGGCLPLLIQMPFFFALFRAITISVDFRQAQFLWIPDLSAADPIHVLPILMAASLLIVQFITPAPTTDPLQRKMTLVMIPAVMLYAMWSAPAGLVVYWLTGNIVLFLQQFFINRLIKTDSDEDNSTTELATA